MYICNDCGAVFDEPAVEREVHFWIDGSPAEEFSVCPECGDTDFTEAFECDGCGEYCSFFSDTAYIDEKGDKFCTASCALGAHGIIKLT